MSRVSFAKKKMGNHDLARRVAPIGESPMALSRRRCLQYFTRPGDVSGAVVA